MTALIFSILATYGLATLVTEYDGPRDIFARIRPKAKVLRCTVCFGVWVAIPFALFSFPNLIISIFAYPAIIGGLIALDRTIN